MALIIVRAVFVLVAGGLAASLVAPNEPVFSAEPIRLFGGIMFLAIGLIALDIFIPIKRIDTITAIYFCLLYTSPSPRDQRGSRMPSSA